MSHCPYLLHKFAINYFFWLLFCVPPRLLELPTALVEYLDLLQGHCSPPAMPLGCYTRWLWNIQYNGTAILLMVNPFMLHRNNRTACPTYVLIVWKEDASLLAMFNPLRSRTNQQLFKKTCNQSSHYENYGQFNGSQHVPTTKSKLSGWTKINGTQRRAVVSPWRRHAFRINLKAFLGLVLPNQCCHIVM